MSLRFEVVPAGHWPTKDTRKFTLVRDRWDDFTFKTSFSLHYTADDGDVTEIGMVKIAHLGMGEKDATTSIKSSFHSLPPNFFSLGQEREYYTNLRKLPGDIGSEALSALRDIALDLERFDEVLGEPVTTVSLTRNIDHTVVRSQFHWLAVSWISVSHQLPLLLCASSSRR